MVEGIFRRWMGPNVAYRVRRGLVTPVDMSYAVMHTSLLWANYECGSEILAVTPWMQPYEYLRQMRRLIVGFFVLGKLAVLLHASLLEFQESGSLVMGNVTGVVALQRKTFLFYNPQIPLHVEIGRTQKHYSTLKYQNCGREEMVGELGHSRHWQFAIPTLVSVV